MDAASEDLATGVEYDRALLSWARVLDDLPDVCAVLDREAVVRYVSPSAEAALGVPAPLLVGRCACDLVDSRDGRNTAAWFGTVAAGGQVPDFVHRLRRADRSYGWFETRARPVRGPDGRIQVLTISRDVSTRTEFDQQLLATSRMWSDVCDVVRQGVLVFDTTGGIVASNATAAAMMGVDRPALTGSRLDTHLRIVVDAQPDRVVAAAHLRKHLGAALTVAVARPDGQVKHFGARASDLHSSSEGSPVGLSVLLLDGLAEPGLPAGRPLPALTPQRVPDPAPPRTAAERVGAGLLNMPAVLSRREIEVLTLLIDGLDIHAISADLGISVHTTRAYVKSVLRKLDVRTQLQAVVIALRTGLISLS